jgi:hypothetical protein
MMQGSYPSGSRWKQRPYYCGLRRRTVFLLLLELVVVSELFVVLRIPFCASCLGHIPHLWRWSSLLCLLIGTLFYLTTHGYVVMQCRPLTFAIPASVVVVWVREVSSLRRRKASVSVQEVVWVKGVIDRGCC